MDEQLKQRLAEVNKDIPTEEIKRFIAEAQGEINGLERVMTTFPNHSSFDNIDNIIDMRRKATANAITERKKFITFLEAILEVRLRE